MTRERDCDSRKEEKKKETLPKNTVWQQTALVILNVCGRELSTIQSSHKARERSKPEYPVYRDLLLLMNRNREQDVCSLNLHLKGNISVELVIYGLLYSQNLKLNLISIKIDISKKKLKKRKYNRFFLT